MTLALCFEIIYLSTINSTTGYFITLAKSVINGGLMIPSGALVNTPKHQQDQAKHEKEDVAMDVLAKRLGEKTEAAYAMYGHLQ